MNRYLAYDVFSLTSRTVTPEGFLVAPGNIARTGIQLYRAMEFGLEESGMDPLRIIRVYRPPEEVFAPASMASFENVPVTLGHPEGNVVHVDNWKDVSHGDAHGISRYGDFMTGTLVIRSKEAVDAVQSGRNELSNGYSFDIDFTPGKTPDGQDYDGVQMNIRGNHVAIVDAARCGSACRIGDEKPNEGDRPMALRKVVVDGIPLEVEETAAAAIDKLLNDRTVALTARDEALGKLKVAVVIGGKSIELGDAAAVTAAVQSLDTQITSLQKDVMTPEARDAMVADWSKMIGDAKRLVPELVTDKKTCVEIRREVLASVSGKDARAKGVVEAVLAGKDLKAADADSLRAAFNAVVAAIPADGKTTATTTTTGGDSAVAAALLGDQKVVAPVASGSSYHERNQNAWQGQQKQ